MTDQDLLPQFIRVSQLKGRPSDDYEPRATIVAVDRIIRIGVNDSYETEILLEGGTLIRVDEPFEHFERVLDSIDLAAIGYPETGNRALRSTKRA